MCVYLYVYMCLYMYVSVLCISVYRSVYACVCECVRTSPYDSSFTQLVWLTKELQRSACFCIYSADITDTHYMPNFMQVLGI